jgi:hypothetical protein
MKLIKSKQIQKAEGRKKGIYEITLQVSDYDIEMLEDLAITYAPFHHDIFNSKKFPYSWIKRKVGIEILEYKPQYQRWLLGVWHEFWKLWKHYD